MLQQVPWELGFVPTSLTLFSRYEHSGSPWCNLINPGDFCPFLPDCREVLCGFSPCKFGGALWGQNCFSRQQPRHLYVWHDMGNAGDNISWIFPDKWCCAEDEQNGSFKDCINEHGFLLSSSFWQSHLQHQVFKESIWSVLLEYKYIQRKTLHSLQSNSWRLSP